MGTIAKQAHTPGPWMLLVEKTLNGQHVAGRGPIVATLDAREVCRITSGMTRKAMAAAEVNARLIAAAPEMLKALEQVYRALENDEAFTCGDTGIKVREAISKARGEQ